MKNDSAFRGRYQKTDVRCGSGAVLIRKNMAKLQGKKKVIVIIASVLVGFGLFALCGLMFAGYRFAWGPFYPLADHYFAKLPGNAEKYAVENVEPLEHSPLEGMDIVFLGLP